MDKPKSLYDLIAPNRIKKFEDIPDIFKVCDACGSSTTLPLIGGKHLKLCYLCLDAAGSRARELLVSLPDDLLERVVYLASIDSNCRRRQGEFEAMGSHTSELNRCYAIRRLTQDMRQRLTLRMEPCSDAIN